MRPRFLGDGKMPVRADMTISLRIEGKPTFESLQKFLACVHTVSEKRLVSRFMYAARKTG